MTTDVVKPRPFGHPRSQIGVDRGQVAFDRASPGLILGRFKIGMDSPTRPVNLIIGAGYQVAVTPNPVTQNNVVATARITF